MARKKKHEEHVNHERWLVSYADFITLLFATFTALFAMSKADAEKFAAAAESLKKAFNTPSAQVDSGTPELPSVTLEGGANPSGNMIININTRGGPMPRSESRKSEGDPTEDEMTEDDESLFDGSSLFDGGRGEEDDGTGNITAATPTPTPTPTPLPEEEETPPGEAGPMGKAEGGTDAGLAQELKVMLEDAGLDGKVEVHEEQRGTVISLGEAAFFASGSIDVLPASRHQLDKIINALRGRSFELRVEGHTDNTPVSTGRFYHSNLELSTLRAARIVDFMIKEYRFPGNLISSAGYGEYRPVADNATPQGRQKNRRVDIVILNERSAQAEPRS